MKHLFAMLVLTPLLSLVPQTGTGGGGTGGGGSTPTGPAGGDLSGTYPNPTVSAVHATSGTLNGVVIGGVAPASGTFTTLSSTSQVTTPFTITPSASPALVATNGLQSIVLSTNTTPTMSGIASGQRVTFEICQPVSGGPYSWTFPAQIHGGVSSSIIAAMASNTCAIQAFDSFNGTTLVAESTGVTGVAP